MTTTTARTYSIRDVAALTGLRASTLRYYESVGVVPPVGRGETSGHRVYTEADLDQLSWISCLAATGMPVADMRRYVANGTGGAPDPAEQAALLAAQDARLEREQAQIAVRRRYVALKIAYWDAVAAGDHAAADRLGAEAASLADDLKHDPRHHPRHGQH